MKNLSSISVEDLKTEIQIELAAEYADNKKSFWRGALEGLEKLDKEIIEFPDTLILEGWRCWLMPKNFTDKDNNYFRIDVKKEDDGISFESIRKHLTVKAYARMVVLSTSVVHFCFQETMISADEVIDSLYETYPLLRNEARVTQFVKKLEQEKRVYAAGRVLHLDNDLKFIFCKKVDSLHVEYRNLAGMTEKYDWKEYKELHTDKFFIICNQKF